jgi:hypothetical protein
MPGGDGRGTGEGAGQTVGMEVGGTTEVKLPGGGAGVLQAAAVIAAARTASPRQTAPALTRRLMTHAP